MTEQTKVQNQILPSFTEAPASVNFYGVTSKGWNVQFTLRDDSEEALLARFAAFVGMLEDKYHVSPKPVGQQPQAATQPATNGTPPPAQGSHGQSVCAMVEVGTAYQSNKPQLKFHCDGLEHPLTFTKAAAEMAKLLEPIGIAAADITVGRKFLVNAVVSWEQGEKYKNVLAVTPR